ncbi:hypothetical protein BU16DRAFT_532732 [Lophium mytilinum]|uniref:Uncharacterized protein n=1 Tax=Lophium mytilinum TaxID=390894 RepID=A0A6A6RF45_9PEZI|nr:hypothetical protein BU16DRAFT_532732 [Lophium mytilinum]
MDRAPSTTSGSPDHEETNPETVSSRGEDDHEAEILVDNNSVNSPSPNGSDTEQEDRFINVASHHFNNRVVRGFERDYDGAIFAENNYFNEPSIDGSDTEEQHRDATERDYFGRGFDMAGYWMQHRPSTRCSPGNPNAFRVEQFHVYLELEPVYQRMVRVLVLQRGQGLTLAINSALTRREMAVEDRREFLPTLAGPQNQADIRVQMSMLLSLPTTEFLRMQDPTVTERGPELPPLLANPPRVTCLYFTACVLRAFVASGAVRNDTLGGYFCNDFVVPASPFSTVHPGTLVVLSGTADKE